MMARIQVLVVLLNLVTSYSFFSCVSLAISIIRHLCNQQLPHPGAWVSPKGWSWWSWWFLSIFWRWIPGNMRLVWLFWLVEVHTKALQWRSVWVEDPCPVLPASWREFDIMGGWVWVGWMVHVSFALQMFIQRLWNTSYSRKHSTEANMHFDCYKHIAKVCKTSSLSTVVWYCQVAVKLQQRLSELCSGCSSWNLWGRMLLHSSGIPKFWCFLSHDTVTRKQPSPF